MRPRPCERRAWLAGGVNPRSVFWSPSAAMGTNISALPLRPGDVGRIVNPLTLRSQVEGGAVQGIEAVTQLVARHFPLAPGDRNELPDAPLLL